MGKERVQSFLLWNRLWFRKHIFSGCLFRNSKHGHRQHHLEPLTSPELWSKFPCQVDPIIASKEHTEEDLYSHSLCLMFFPMKLNMFFGKSHWIISPEVKNSKHLSKPPHSQLLVILVETFDKLPIAGAIASGYLPYPKNPRLVFHVILVRGSNIRVACIKNLENLLCFTNPKIYTFQSLKKAHLAPQTV